MNMMNSKFFEAFKKRAEKQMNQPLPTPEEIRERFRKSEFFKKLQESKIKKSNKEE